MVNKSGKNKNKKNQKKDTNDLWSDSRYFDN